MNRLLCFFRGHDNHFFRKNNFVSFFFVFATKLREKSSLAGLSIQIKFVDNFSTYFFKIH